MIGRAHQAASTPRIFGLELSLLDREALAEELLATPHEPAGAKLVATINVDHVVTLRTDQRFRDAYDSAWRITADGAPVYLYARASGVRVPERVTGSDLFATLVERWDPKRHRLYMLVANDEAARRMTRILAERGYDEDTLTIDVPKFGFEKDAAYNEELTARIRAKRPTHIILGVGAPKSEIWAYEHRHALGDAVVLCVGAAIEFTTGLKQRSPMFMRRVGMEWMWRFGTEPRRLFHRYFVRSFGFILAVIADRPRAAELQARND
ncbi:WecB/TagA/CpsF family glycosyltransferase [Sphingomonas sp. LHG3406-1]|uniref:WecB/TagA/CpsF family glycosyltransferase n=1 Tax=Sphingomonas sp. LHG3406-1 TaxID=2804617 RepID=UPI00263719A1|nr:WecB/TagA/CpsF family glycosyltransferase [Sphingomonas sp. LHG3406-1]